MKKENNTQGQEDHTVPNKLDPKRSTLRQIIIKMTWLKDKKRILKATREKEAVTNREHELDYYLIYQQKYYYTPGGSGMKYPRLIFKKRSRKHR